MRQVVVLIHDPETGPWDGACIGPFASWDAADTWIAAHPELRDAHPFTLIPQGKSALVVSHYCPRKDNS